MSPSISEQLEPIVKSLSKFLWRFHVIIYSVVVIGGVAIAIFLLSGLLAVPTEEPQTASISFDKKTMQLLKTSDRQLQQTTRLVCQLVVPIRLPNRT